MTVLATARRGHRGLYAFAVAMAALTPVLAVLAVVDARVLLGAPLWLKPLKFAISFGLYAITLAWMIGRAPRWRRTLWWLGTLAVVGFVTSSTASPLDDATTRGGPPEKDG